jgi:nitric oxide reductase NorD protein
MKSWFGARRLLLKSRYAAETARDRVRSALRIGPEMVPLERVQRRLEIVLAAVYGRQIPIEPIETNVWTRERVRQFAKGDIRGAEATPGIDGERIYLPPELRTAGNEKRALARYRLFAMEQAERIARGTALHAPLTDPLERDLYFLREGAAVDAEIARRHPGLIDTLTRERRSVLSRRPNVEHLTPAERDVETMVRATLAGDVDEGAVSAGPDESLRWARETASRIRMRGAKYRGLPPAPHWGIVRDAEEELREAPADASKRMLRGSFDRREQQTESGQATNSAGRANDREAKDQGEANDGDTASSDGAYEIHARVQIDPDALPDHANALAGRMGDLRDPSLDGLPAPVFYDEWNGYQGGYVKRAAAVRLHVPTLGDPEWARTTLREHAAIVRQVRQQFERLRARRTLLSRQRAGDDLDIAAVIDAMVDRRLGESPDDRLYLDARPARRGLAIAIVVDTSGSTEQRVTDAWRIVDLEKIALLLATEALDALGDLYAVYAFAGKSAANVKVDVVKEFCERSGDTVHRRIASLSPGGFTRMGAAIRHATAQLARQSAGHRLLLLLSDGRPNDIDLYQGPYGVEDARQAIFEARASGVFPFCITIDRDASEYLPRIFGQAGHTILQRPQQLPTALLAVVRKLIGRS